MVVTEEIIVKIRAVVEDFRSKMSGVKEVLEANTSQFQSQVALGNKLQGSHRRLAVGVRKLFLGLKDFRMEMLSVMFFGMGLKNFFTGLLQPALQLVGFFDVLNIAMGLLFLPTAMMLLDWGLKFLDWVMNMSPETQALIGKIVLFGIVLGTGLFILGQFTLAFGGLLMTFGFVAAAIISLVTSPIALLLAALLGGIALLIGKDSLAFAFDAVGNIADKVFQKILDLFPGLRVKLEEMGIHTQSLGKAWADVYDKWIKPKVEAVKAKIAEFIEDFKNRHPEVLDRLKMWGERFEWVAEKVSDLVGWVGKLIDKLSGLSWEKAKNYATSGGIYEQKHGKPVWADFNFPWTGAAGGVVTQPTPAIIGEAGPEAVIPLNKLGSFGSVTVNVNVTGYTDRDLVSNITNAVRDELERITRRA